jgi:hypothetical protein
VDGLLLLFGLLKNIIQSRYFSQPEITQGKVICIALIMLPIVNDESGHKCAAQKMGLKLFEKK